MSTNNVNNVNNGKLTTLTNNVTMVEREPVDKSVVAKADGIASVLVEKLRSPESYKFYCKVAYKLPESRIWQNYESAMKGKNPGGLFNWLCRKDMA